MGNKIRKTVPSVLKNTKCYLVLFGLTHDISSGATICSYSECLAIRSCHITIVFQFCCRTGTACGQNVTHGGT